MSSTSSPPLDKSCNPYLTPPLDGETLVAPPVKGCEDIVCLWKNCFRTFNDAELLYFHLSNDHVGRKSTGNLCLVCHWDGCGNSSKKRDHITSHLRVHVSSKPHVCELCGKAFKRPQDLKKHEKIHYTQHQRKIFDSGITKGQSPTPPQLLPDDSPGTSSAPSPQLPCSPNSVASGSPAYNFLYPIPQNMPQFSDGAYEDDHVKTKYSQKRSIDVFEEFYQDVKKQRINPKYNEGLIDKLQCVSSALDGINIDQESLPPSLRKKEDINILENFLTQALKEVEYYSDSIYTPTNNIGYSWENIDSGDTSYNFPSSIGDVYPPTTYYVGDPSLQVGDGQVHHTPLLNDYFIDNGNTLEPSIHLFRQYKTRPPCKDKPSVDTSDISGESTDSPVHPHEHDATEEKDLVKILSDLNINDNKKPSDSEKHSEGRRNHAALINSILKKVADFSKHLSESSVRPGEAVQPNASSNFPKKSLPTQPIADDKLNLGVESLVVVNE